MDVNSTVKPKNGTKMILAFGDSLTKGYYNRGKDGGVKYHPYSIMMNNLFEQNNLPFRVLDSGVNGQKSIEMISRLKEELETSNYRFKLIIIFAGTNDLGYFDNGNEIEKIAENIIGLYKIAAQNAIPCLIANLPENEFDIIEPKFTEKKQKLNQLIKSFSESYRDIYICDLEKEMPFLSRTKEERNIYWDDELHFTPAGYDELGRIFYENMKFKFNLYS
jgi:lysophospholipase L1-like esterase